MAGKVRAQVRIKVTVNRFRTIVVALTSLLSGFVSPVFAELTPEQAVIDKRTMAAIQLYYRKGCQACHGLLAEGVVPKNGPQLAGLSEPYLIRQLTHFRDRVRGGSFDDLYGRQMTQAANSLSDDDITMLAELISAIPPRFVSQSMLGGDAGSGKRIYQEKDCARCHGVNGEGEDPAPRVAGQQDAYLALQLRRYQQGVRGNHPADKHGRQMAGLANLLESEQAIIDVSVYMASLNQPSIDRTNSDPAIWNSGDVVLNYYSRLDGGDKNVIYHLLAPDVVFHFPGGRDAYGPNNYWAIVSQVGIYVPDFRHVLTDVRIDERDPTIVHVGKIDVRGITAAGQQKSFPSEHARYKVVGGRITEAWIK